MKVKLTDAGIKILEDEYNFYQELRPVEMREPFKLNLTDDGWYRSQAWCIFQTFGQHIRMGGNPPFETEIEIEE